MKILLLKMLACIRLARRYKVNTDTSGEVEMITFWRWTWAITDCLKFPKGMRVDFMEPR